MTEPNGTFKWRLESIEDSVKQLQRTYVSKDQFDKFEKHVDTMFDDQTKDIKSLRTALIGAALSVTVSAVLFALSISLIVRPG